VSWRLRLRALGDAWFEVLAVVLVVIVLLGAWGTYTAHVNPGTTTTERIESTWAMEGNFDHEAEVTEPNRVYEQGTTLENRTIYPIKIAPEMNGVFVFGYEASDNGEVDVEINLTVHRQAIVDEEDESETKVPVWEDETEIDTQTASSLAPGAEQEVPFSFNISEVENETQQIEEELGNVPGAVETAVRAEVHLSGTVNGESVEETQTYTLPIDSSGDTYTLSKNSQDREEFESTIAVPVERSHPLVLTAGAPLVVIISLLLLGGLVVAKRRGLTLDERERDYLAYRDDREDFDEWITTMSLPDEIAESVHIEAASLGDLVDFAISADTGVIYDPDREVYVVRHEETHYCYHPPNEIPDTDTDESDQPAMDVAKQSDGAEAIDAEQFDETQIANTEQIDETHLGKGNSE